MQTEREDMLNAIRDLTRAVKLKDIIMNNFMPEECVKGIENRAKWSDPDDCWIIPVSIVNNICIEMDSYCL